MTTKLAVSRALNLLKKHYPDAHCALDHKGAFQLLIATILSAQCTDERVNIVTKDLFRKFPDPIKMAIADLAELEEIIRSTGFYKNKAKHILATAKILAKEYQGKVPSEMDLLTKLPGVGRKTANVVLGNAFGITSGVVVDTHVFRLSRRLGWATCKTPETVEKELQALVPEKEWILLSHLLIFHGRKLCSARKPKCSECFLTKDCPSSETI